MHQLYGGRHSGLGELPAHMNPLYPVKLSNFVTATHYFKRTTRVLRPGLTRAAPAAAGVYRRSAPSPAPSAAWHGANRRWPTLLGRRGVQRAMLSDPASVFSGAKSWCAAYVCSHGSSSSMVHVICAGKRLLPAVGARRPATGVAFRRVCVPWSICSQLSASFLTQALGPR